MSDVVYSMLVNICCSIIGLSEDYLFWSLGDGVLISRSTIWLSIAKSRLEMKCVIMAS